jgi:NAD-dependent dihydropyrimidine dehydrogenase PreA subunit
MSDKWYPVINYEKCIECGACVELCPNGVYEKESNSPNVIHPENCSTGGSCCQAQCPADAIEYVGDKQAEEKNECSCAGGCGCGADSGCC